MVSVRVKTFRVKTWVAIGLGAAVATVGMMSSSATAGTVSAPKVVVEAPNGDSLTGTSLGPVSRDGSVVGYYLLNGGLRFVDGGTIDPASYLPFTPMSANGRFLFREQELTASGLNRHLRTDRTNGATLNFWVGMGNGYAGPVAAASDNGRIVGINASSGELGRTNGFVYDVGSDTVLTPGASGIGAAVGNSLIVDVSSDGRFITYAEYEVVGGDFDRFIRWDRLTGDRLTVEMPAGHSAWTLGWTVSPYLSKLSYVNGSGDLIVRDRVSGAEATLPDPASAVLSYFLTEQGDVVYEKDAPTKLAGAAPLLFVWGPGDPSPTQISIGLGGADPASPVEDYTVSDDGAVVTFLSDADNLVAGADTLDFRIFQVTINTPVSDPVVNPDARGIGAAVVVAPAVRGQAVTIP